MLRRTKRTTAFGTVTLAIAGLVFAVACHAQDRSKKPPSITGKPAKPFKASVKGIDPAAKSLKAKVRRRLSANESELVITGVVQNIGTDDFESGRGQQVVRLYEHRPGAKPRLYREYTFTKLKSGEKIFMHRRGSWSGSAEFPQDFVLQIEYDPDIRLDDNPKNDDVVSKDNRKVIKGAEITAMVRNWLATH